MNKTRLIIFEVQEDGYRSIRDIMEWTGTLTLLDIVKSLPKINFFGTRTVAERREHAQWLLSVMGTTDYPIVIEHFQED